MSDFLDFEEAAAYLSSKTGKLFTSQKIYRLASEWSIQPSLRLVGLHCVEVIDKSGQRTDKDGLNIEGFYRLKKSQTNIEIIGFFFHEKLEELRLIPPVIVHSDQDKDLFFKIYSYKVGLDLAVHRLIYGLKSKEIQSNQTQVRMNRVLSDPCYICFKEDDLDDYAMILSKLKNEKLSCQTDFEYSADNILKRNEIKKDLQAMARVIAAHLWTNETKRTRIGDMADKVYREVCKFAPTGYMPEKTEAVEDWIRCVAPDYATKGGRPRTPP